MERFCQFHDLFKNNLNFALEINILFRNDCGGQKCNFSVRNLKLHNSCHFNDKKSSPFKVVKQEENGGEIRREKQFFTKKDRGSKKLRLFFTEEDDHPEHQLRPKMMMLQILGVSTNSNIFIRSKEFDKNLSQCS